MKITGWVLLCFGSALLAPEYTPNMEIGTYVPMFLKFLLGVFSLLLGSGLIDKAKEEKHER